MIPSSGCPGHEILKKCREKGICVTAYSPLGSDASKLHDDPVVKEIAEKHGVAPSNILISLQANREGVTGKELSKLSHLALLTSWKLFPSL